MTNPATTKNTVSFDANI